MEPSGLKTICIPMSGAPYVCDISNNSFPPWKVPQPRMDKEIIQIDPMSIRWNDHDLRLRQLELWEYPFEIIPPLINLGAAWNNINIIINNWCQTQREGAGGFKEIHPEINIYVANNINDNQLCKSGESINNATRGTYLSTIIQEPTGICVPDLSKVAPTPRGNIIVCINENSLAKYNKMFESFNTFSPLYTKGICSGSNYMRHCDANCVFSRKEFRGEPCEGLCLNIAAQVTFRDYIQKNTPIAL